MGSCSAGIALSKVSKGSRCLLLKYIVIVLAVIHKRPKGVSLKRATLTAQHDVSRSALKRSHTADTQHNPLSWLFSVFLALACCNRALSPRARRGCTPDRSAAINAHTHTQLSKLLLTNTRLSLRFLHHSCFSLVNLCHRTRYTASLQAPGKRLRVSAHRSVSPSPTLTPTPTPTALDSLRQSLPCPQHPSTQIPRPLLSGSQLSPLPTTSKGPLSWEVRVSPTTLTYRWIAIAVLAHSLRGVIMIARA